VFLLLSFQIGDAQLLSVLIFMLVRQLVRIEEVNSKDFFQVRSIVDNLVLFTEIFQHFNIWLNYLCNLWLRHLLYLKFHCLWKLLLIEIFNFILKFGDLGSGRIPVEETLEIGLVDSYSIDVQTWNLVIDQRSNDDFGSLFRPLDLQEGMQVINCLLTFLTVVEIMASRTFVAGSHNGFNPTAITPDSIMNLFEFEWFLGGLDLSFNLRNQLFHFGSNDLGNFILHFDFLHLRLKENRPHDWDSRLFNFFQANGPDFKRISLQQPLL